MIPKCKCGGMLVTEKDWHGSVESVKCIIRSRRRWRDFQPRRPSGIERVEMNSGIPSRKWKGAAYGVAE